MAIAAVASRDEQHIQIRADSGRIPIEFREIYRNRELLLTLAIRDIKVRYKQTALGAIWVILQPLMASLIFAFIFGVIAKMPSDGQPYILFAFAGLISWNLFSQIISKASISLIGNANMISKVYFPRLIMPLSSTGSALVDFAVSLVMMFVLLAIYQVWPGYSLLLLPVWVTILTLMGLGIGLMAGSLMVKYRDVGHIIPTFLQLGLFATPVAWSTLLVPGKFRWVFLVNPLTGLMEAVRWSLLGEGELSAWRLVYSTAAALFLFWLGAVIFKQQESEFADVI